ncbi:MAG: hypothetical protein JWR29_1639 [Tardiphaga sp.]|nr:hypothetical protein [Tardiphaga sp.]
MERAIPARIGKKTQWHRMVHLQHKDMGAHDVLKTCPRCHAWPMALRRKGRAWGANPDTEFLCAACRSMFIEVATKTGTTLKCTVPSVE